MATVLQTFTLRPKAGKVDEARAELTRATEMYKSRGASAARVFWSIDAGEASGNVILAVEYPSASAWAANVDSEDEEMARVRNYLANAEGPLEILGTALHREVAV